MSKQRKKRTKQYTGEDAHTSSKGPVVHHYVATRHSRLGEWWLEHKKATILISKIAAGVIIFIWLLIEGLHLIFH